MNFAARRLQLFPRQCKKVLASIQYFSRSRPPQKNEATSQARFSRTGWSDKGQCFPQAYLQRDVIQRGRGDTFRTKDASPHVTQGQAANCEERPFRTLGVRHDTRNTPLAPHLVSPSG